ncbi:hypothetical protein [Cetobacterium sp. SF1]|uniref:hypothetical protein n=1 Tax=unclassified Cetobacterium TaxID=2630983 RepID=UPI003CFA9DA2
MEEKMSDDLLLQIKKLKEIILKSDDTDNKLKEPLIKILEKLEKKEITKEEALKEADGILKNFGEKAFSLKRIISDYAITADYLGI